jgi:hypothetical protein
MSESTTYNGQIPTDPAKFAVLILIAAAVIGRLTPDQADSLRATLELVLFLSPHLPRAGR